MKEPLWLDEHDALTLHDRLLVLHGGAAGLRDMGLLQSALAPPRQLFAYGGAFDIVALAASYAFGIVRNHPFADGNKRTAFIMSILFLELNGHGFTASEEDAARAVIALAAGTMDEAAYAAFLAANIRNARD